MTKQYSIVAAVWWLAFCTGLAAVQAAPDSDTIQLVVQHRNEAGEPERKTVTIEPSRTAVVVIDMWDRHWCETYTRRVANMVPRMNLTLEAARKLGMTVVHAPSDVLDFYGDAPQRQAMQAVPAAQPPNRVTFDPPPTPPPTDHCECSSDLNAAPT